MSKQTGNTCPFTERADSQQLAVRELKSNLPRKTTHISHLQLSKMESSARDGGNSSDGKSDSSLIELLHEITDYPNEIADNVDNSIDWSEEALLSESSMETGTALKVAAQSVTQAPSQAEINSQSTVEKRIKGDNSQPDVLQAAVTDPSVLKVTKGMEICVIGKRIRRPKTTKGSIPHKEIHPVTEQASRTQPARPAQSREVKIPAKVILEITENHDWFKDFESDGEGTHQTDKSQHPSCYAPSPVLKVTGGLGDNAIVDNQSALKVADGNCVMGRDPPHLTICVESTILELHLLL